MVRVSKITNGKGVAVAKRLFIYLIGLIITALGIALVIRSTVGAGPWDSVAVGFKVHLGLTIGIWSIIVQGLLMVTTAIVEKARLRMESIVAIVIRSWFLDAWFYLVLADINFSSSLAMKWLSFSGGIIAVGLGIGTYMEAKFPKTPVDGLMTALCVRFGWSLSVSRLVIELSGVTLGFILGGPVGLGTIITALSLGRIIQVSNYLIKNLVTHFQKKHSSVNMERI